MSLPAAAIDRAISGGRVLVVTTRADRYREYFRDQHWPPVSIALLTRDRIQFANGGELAMCPPGGERGRYADLVLSECISPEEAASITIASTYPEPNFIRVDE